ncbi:MAG: MFS transporter [Candidatus Paceibacterota bacterium]|jgi:MFS family permease
MKINRVIKYLILADLAFWTGWGLVSPVFPIFIVERIGGTAFSVGIAVAVYWITKSILEYPIGLLLDRRKGDDDDYTVLVCGALLACVIPVGYILVKEMWNIYVLQFFYGVGMAASIAGWRALFTRNIDKGHEAADWSLDDTVLGFGTGISSLISGFLVYKFGFEPSFIVATSMGLLGVVFLLCLKKDILGSFGSAGYFDLKKIFNLNTKKRK